jgi:uncharacterized protein involved in exopolysaccharide biosynthesis
LALVCGGVFLWPPLYRSEATILIERQTIPSEVIETTVTGYVQEQIEQLRQKFMTWDNLSQLAQKFDLYPGIRVVATGQSRCTRLARTSKSKWSTVQASNPDQTGERVATIAFTVAV